MQTYSDYSFIQKAGELTEDGVIIYDLDSRKFKYTNRNFLKMFGLQVNHLSDTSLLLQLIMAEDVEYLKDRFNELLSKRYISSAEFRLKFPEGRVKHLSCDVMMLEDHNVITAFIKDVSRIKLHEDFLIKCSAQKDTMLEMLTHNLSGPLQLSDDLITSIKKGYSENNLVNMNKLISIMHDNTKHCIDIVNDFLREEHTESVNTYVKKTRFDIIEKISLTVDKLRDMNPQITFEVVSDEDILNVNTDAVKFYQVLHNVLSNSIKYTRAKGVITITVKEENKKFTVCINDNGVGIPSELQSLIFTQRIQGRPGLNGEKSNGMGLSIAKRLVDIMDGKIWFESTEGNGTSFYVQLPAE